MSIRAGLMLLVIGVALGWPGTAAAQTCGPAQGDCCADGGNGTPGCADPGCCALICKFDPFCCGADGGFWDAVCAGNAQGSCPVCLKGCSGDADCDNNNACDGLEVCDPNSGVCQPGVPPECDDGDPCTLDGCDSGLGCISTFLDAEPPQVICPPEVFVECDASLEPADTGFPEVFDNCDLTLTATHFDEMMIPDCNEQTGALARTWLATDSSGNTGSCSQIIVQGDTTPPVLLVPPDLTLSCGDPTEPTFTGLAEGSDNCTEIVGISHVDSVAGACPQDSVLTRAWTALDDCGNGITLEQVIVLEGMPCSITDLNGDGVTNAADLAQLLGSWGPSGGPADFNHDGVVNASDLAQLLGSWGSCPGACCFPEGVCIEEQPTVCQESGGVPQVPGSTCAEVTCAVDVCGVNLTIYKSQFGPAVGENEEEIIGSYTVANLNDTDGDGATDVGENNVSRVSRVISAAAAAGSSSVSLTNVEDVNGLAVGNQVIISSGGNTQVVTITNLSSPPPVIEFAPPLAQDFPAGSTLGNSGRDEVDLMKLVLEGAGPPDKTKRLSLLSGSAKVWGSSKKLNEIPLPVEYPINETVTLWVEATAPSAAVRDIALKLECVGAWDSEDIVKATGVWATVTAWSDDTTSAADLLAMPAWMNLTNPPSNLLAVYGGTGLRPIGPAPVGVANAILIKFQLVPPGINAEPPAGGRGAPKFDGSRQKEGKTWSRNGANACNLLIDDSWPMTEELPNDDARNLDKSSAPNGDDEYFDFDVPGLRGDGAAADLVIRRLNFKEFLRVRFDGIRPSGNIVDGSRCSPYWDWHVRHRLVDNAGTWARSGGEPPETNDNDIAPGHIDLGGCP